MIGRVEVDPKSLIRLTTALDAEADGKELTRDLVRGLVAAAEPAKEEARAAILAMPSRGSWEEPGLRATVASRVMVRVKLRQGSVAVRAYKTGMPRGFNNAPKRLNSRKGWRRPVYGGQWVHQLGKPGWFDDAMDRHLGQARRAANDAMDDVAKRIDRKTRG